MSEQVDPGLIESAIKAIRRSGIGKRARETAIDHARSAVAVLDTLPDSDYRDALSGFVSELVDREL